MARPAVERGVNVSMVLVDVIVVDLCMRVVFREREHQIWCHVAAPEGVKLIMWVHEESLRGFFE